MLLRLTKSDKSMKALISQILFYLQYKFIFKKNKNKKKDKKVRKVNL